MYNLPSRAKRSAERSSRSAVEAGRGAGGEIQERCYLLYRGTIDGRRIAVLWREIHDWGQADFECDRDFVAAQKLIDGADEVFVNGDSLIPGARALEPVFKARMFAPVKALWKD